MNFLSHLHIDGNDDLYHNVGLTIPDVIGFHNRRFRFTEKKLILMHDDPEFKHLRGFVEGMLKHVRLDARFHRHEIFRECTNNLSTGYTSYSGTELGAFYSHILFEILIDRTLLLRNPDLANRFYREYKSFNFSSVVSLFEKYGEFDRDRFVDFSNLVANSNFLNEYSELTNIRSILHRVARRVDSPLEIAISDNSFAEYCTQMELLISPSVNAVLVEFTDKKSSILFNA